MQLNKLLLPFLWFLICQMQCNKACSTDYDVRLQDTTSQSSATVTGRVEVCYRGSWYSISTTSPSSLADVVCRQLNYCEGNGSVSMSGTLHSTTVDCLGIETSIASCNSTLLGPTSLPSIVDTTIIQCNAILNSPQAPSISIVGTDSFTFSWHRPSVTDNCNIETFKVVCTDVDMPSRCSWNKKISYDSTNISVQTDFYLCNYTCCVQSCRSVGCSATRCTSIPVPDPPVNVEATVVGPQSVEVSWYAPPSNFYHITGYRLYSSASTNINYQNVNNTYYLFDNSLVQNTAYTFYVRSDSVAGLSSNSSETTVTTAPPTAPTNVHRRYLTSTSFVLQWDQPTPTYEQLYSFNINCTDSYNGRYSSFNKSRSTRNHTLTDLQPGAHYECCVRAVNNAGSNRACIGIETLESTPTGPPQNVRHEIFNSTAIMFSWSEPLYEERNGEVRNYSLRVCQTDPEGSCTYHQIMETQLELNLHPQYNYSWSAAAINSIAMGPYSTPSTLQMPEDKPSGPPQNVTHSGDRSVQLFWSPPSLTDQNGIIISYNVYVLDSQFNILTINTEYGTMTAVQSLEESTPYLFWVSANTAVGEGPYTEYGPVTTAIGVKYGVLIAAGISVLTIIPVLVVIMCLCWRKQREIKAKLTGHNGPKKEVKSSSSNAENKNTLARLYESNPQCKDDSKPSTLQRIRKWFNQYTKTTTVPPIPSRRYLEDDNFMQENFDGQPAIPPRTNMELVSMCSNNDQEELPPQSYLMDEAFVEGLDQFVAKVTGEEELEEEKIYQPLIPPRRYEEGCEENESVYQPLTVNKSRDDSSEAIETETSLTTTAPPTESHYQPLTKRTEESVYEKVVIPDKEDSIEDHFQPLTGRRTKGSNFEMVAIPRKDSANIQPARSNSESIYQPLIVKRMEESVYEKATIPDKGDDRINIQPVVRNNSEGHYQPLMNREEPSHYRTVTLPGKTLPAAVEVEQVGDKSEGVYQALFRVPEENAYQSLTLRRET